jgi:hypothetical protein
MKEENNAAANAQQPSEAEMNDRYQNDWLNFHADAQQAKQDLNRRYAKMVNTFGSYKNMPDGVKEILKDDYAAHEAKWKENGEEMQKRFGVKETPLKSELTEDLQKKKQEFVQQLQQQQSRNLNYERT